MCVLQPRHESRPYRSFSSSTRSLVTRLGRDSRTQALLPRTSAIAYACDACSPSTHTSEIRTIASTRIFMSGRCLTSPFTRRYWWRTQLKVAALKKTSRSAATKGRYLLRSVRTTRSTEPRIFHSGGLSTFLMKSERKYLRVVLCSRALLHQAS